MVRSLAMFMLLACAFSATAGKVTEVTGTFQGVEQGDYFYFQLRTDGGDTESYMILETTPALAAFADAPDALIGARVKAKVEDRVENIPEAGGPMDVRVIVDVVRIDGGAAAARPPSHCSAAETIVFTCDTGRKLLSVCASSGVTADTGYVRYRYGPAGAPEIEWPDASDTTRNQLAGGTLMFSGGGGAYLRFVRSDHDYVVYTAIGKGWGEKSGVAVERFGKVVANPKCANAPTSELGQAFFDQAGIVADDQGFELPD